MTDPSRLHLTHSPSCRCYAASGSCNLAVNNRLGPRPPVVNGRLRYIGACGLGLGGAVSGVAVVAPGASQPGRAQKKGRLSQSPRAVIRIKWPRPGPGEAVYETGFRRLR